MKKEFLSVSRTHKKVFHGRVDGRLTMPTIKDLEKRIKRLEIRVSREEKVSTRMLKANFERGDKELELERRVLSWDAIITRTLKVLQQQREEEAQFRKRSRKWIID